MAFENVLTTITLQSSQDMTNYQYCFVSFSTLGYVMPTTGPTNLAGAYSMPIGVLQDRTTAVYGPCKVAIDGVSKLMCGNTSGSESAQVISYGTRISPSSGSIGHGVASTAAGLAIGGFSLTAGPTSGALGYVAARLTCFNIVST